MKVLQLGLALLAGCSAFTLSGCVTTQQQSPPAQQGTQDHIIVTSSDLTGQPYRILGPVAYPGKGITPRLLGTTSCGPDSVRSIAIEKYGHEVNAIINFTQSEQKTHTKARQAGGRTHCRGTAVSFTDNDAIPHPEPTPAQPAVMNQAAQDSPPGQQVVMNQAAQDSPPGQQVAMNQAAQDSPPGQQVAVEQIIQEPLPAQQRLMERIIVTSGDLIGQPYRILGPVAYPGNQVAPRLLGTTSCGADTVRSIAIEKYGPEVNAIIDFAQSEQKTHTKGRQAGSRTHCRGTAVSFIDHDTTAPSAR